MTTNTTPRNQVSRRGLFASAAIVAASLALRWPRRAAATALHSVDEQIIDNFPHAHISIYMIGL